MKSSAYSLTSVDNLNSFYFYKKTLINPFSLIFQNLNPSINKGGFTLWVIN